MPGEGAPPGSSGAAAARRKVGFTPGRRVLFDAFYLGTPVN
jgi:hypothetical protein